MPDIHIEPHGSVVLFRPASDTAHAWVAENVAIEDWQWLGGAFAVDHRYAGDLAQGMREAGLAVA